MRQLTVHLPLPEGHLERIDQSHERCAANGLSRIERPDHAPLGRPDLTVVRERNRRLYTHAAPLMEMLFEQIVGTQSMVVLCDATGTIIHSIGDDEFLARASKVALRPGVNWSELSKGTNAIGTALVEELPTLVHADEHYMHANQFLTCSAAPILDPRGSVLGVLDVTGDHRSYHQHTMALVKMSARMIENHWLSDDHQQSLRLHFHSRVGYLGTLMEGILAVTPDGRIVGANRSALEQLGLSGAALRMRSLLSLFGTTVGALVDRFRSPLATPLQVSSDAERSFHLLARFDWPVWTTVTEAVAEAVPTAKSRPSRSAADAPHVAGLTQLQTGDKQMQALLDKLRRVVDRDIPILIQGETGTGKALLAHAIHADSMRAQRPFVAVNCAAIPDTLIEAELFGYEEGTFAGARRNGAVGKIQQAHGGTLFLDEVGDMPLALQAHLLRVLQERQVTPLGAGKAVPAEVALICATHRRLRDRVDAKTFREDLYYRLNGLAVRVPALRDRTDLAALVRRILDGDTGGRHLQLSPEVMALFQHYPWPGNVRQLFNVLRAAVVMAGSDRYILLEHLPDDFTEDAARHAANASAPLVDAPATAVPAMPASPPQSLDALERDAIRQAVDAAGGNISEAAKRLGISRNTIYRKLRWRQSSPPR